MVLGMVAFKDSARNSFHINWLLSRNSSISPKNDTSEIPIHCVAFSVYVRGSWDMTSLFRPDA